MNPIVVAAVVALALIALVIGSNLVSKFADQRRASEREQRRRVDIERAALRGAEERDFAVGIGLRFLDPVGIFHG